MNFPLVDRTEILTSVMMNDPPLEEWILETEKASEKMGETFMNFLSRMRPEDRNKILHQYRLCQHALIMSFVLGACSVLDCADKQELIHKRGRI